MTLLLALVPALALYSVQQSRFLKAIGAVVLCYAAGVLLGNISLGPALEPAKTASSLCVALAIPLLLFSTDVPGFLRSARPAVVSFTLACLAVCLCGYAGGRLFAGVPESREVASMLTAVYIGGTPNMSALAVALGVRQDTFLVVNGADMLLSTLYLVFLTSVGRAVLGRFLPPYPRAEGSVSAAANPERFQLPTPGGAVRAMLLSAVVVAASAGLSLLVFKGLAETPIMLAITTLGVAGSFVPKLHRLPGAFSVGNYLLLIFCVLVGTMTKLANLIAAGPQLPLMVLFIISSSILLHYAAAFCLKLDCETVMITSTAAIMSPPFVVIVAAALGNAEAMAAGITSGLLGYAIANYAGLLVYRLL